MRKFGRRDIGQKEIIRGLRSIGAGVLDLASVGSGCPDILVFWAGALFLMEIKSKTGTLTPDEKTFYEKWPVHIVRTVDEALIVIGAMKKR